MNIKTTVLLLLVLLALGAVAYFTKNGPAPSAGTAAKMIAGYTPDKVASIRIENAERNDKIVLARGAAPGEWDMQEPLKVPADRVGADFLARFFADYEGTKIGVAGAANINLESMGLQRPRAIIEFGGLSEKPVVVKLGAEHPLRKTDMFIQIDSEVWQAPRTIYNSIAKPATRFRDDRVFTLPPPDVSEVVITQGGVSSVLKREGQTWTITAPIRGRADSSLAGRIAATVANMRIEVFENDQPSELASFGLDAPSITLTLRAGGGSQTVQFGRIDGNQTFAVREGQRSIWRVAETDVSICRKHPVEFCDRLVFGKFIRESVKSIQWKGASGEVEIRYDSATRRPAMVKPREADVDREAFEDLLKEMESLAASDTPDIRQVDLAAVGLSPAAGFVELQLKDAMQPVRLDMGVVTGDGVHFRRAGDEYLIKTTVAAAAFLIKPASRLASKSLVSFDSFATGRVELFHFKDGATKTLVFEKDDKKRWVAPGGTDESAAFVNLADELWHVKGSEVIDQPIAEGPLAKPQIEIRVYRQLYNNPTGDEKERDRLGTLRFARAGAADSGGWLGCGATGSARDTGFAFRIEPTIPERVVAFLEAGGAGSKPSK